MGSLQPRTMPRSRSAGSSPQVFFVAAVSLVICLVFLGGETRAQSITDPSEAKAVNMMFSRWGISSSTSKKIPWNANNDLCSRGKGPADIAFLDDADFNPGIICDCGYDNNTLCHVTRLKAMELGLTGTFPRELESLKYLKDLQLAKNHFTGPLPKFIGNFSDMEFLSIGTNLFSGTIPKELGKLVKLKSLSIGANNFSGSLPPELGNLTNLEQIYIGSLGISNGIPATFAKLSKLATIVASDNDFSGEIPEFIGNFTELKTLKLAGTSLQGPIPGSFVNLNKLNELRIIGLSGGKSSLAFLRDMKSLSTLVLRDCNIVDAIPSNIGEYTKMKILDLSFNNLTGSLPLSLFTLSTLNSLFLGNNSLSGGLPKEKSPVLHDIDLSYNELSGSQPSWVNDDILLNLVANKFVANDLDTNAVSSGLSCLQKPVPCYLGNPRYHSFAINCGGDETVTTTDGTVYEMDNQNLSAASYYVTDTKRWAVSSVGTFLDNINPRYTENTLSPITSTSEANLFQAARISPSSLRYYGLDLENGNYTVKLQFAEIGLPNNLTIARRVFDIYIQGKLVDRNIDIRKEAGGSFKALEKLFTAIVTSNYLEINFLWAGKGTCCLPTRGYYGPLISAISVTPNFTPTTTRPGMSSKKRAALVAGVVVGSLALSSVLLYIICVWRRKRRLGSDEDEDLTGVAAMPDSFSYAELRTATEGFSLSNKLGEGGYGSVYKGSLPDGRVIAVKQLSEASLQGKSQFLTELTTVSNVRHRNLVKLYGYCYKESRLLLVYEYLENKSLDQALFGKSGMRLDWHTRFKICLGTARGLAYLHEESRIRIVHRDVKASNILLDSELNPKISDFGLAKLYEDHRTHISCTRVAGTFGYLAPEYAMRGHLTDKVDVFAFGVVAFEVLAGRRNTEPEMDDEKKYLLEWAWNLHESNADLEILDPLLSSYDKEEAIRAIRVAFLCTQGHPAPRPTMSRVVAMLADEAEVGGVASKPAYLTDWQLDDNDGTSNSSIAFTGSSPSTLLYNSR